MRDKVQLVTKFGFVMGESLQIRGDPEWVRTAWEGSLKRLDVEYIDLYYQNCIDAKVPIEATVSTSPQPNLECLHDKHPCQHKDSLLCLPCEIRYSTVLYFLPLLIYKMG